MKLAARAIEAHAFGERYLEPRTEPDGRRLANQEKGGVIMLFWERRPDEWEQRMIHVSQRRAFQAMDALEAGRGIA